jgi:hypothetical protein
VPNQSACEGFSVELHRAKGPRISNKLPWSDTLPTLCTRPSNRASGSLLNPDRTAAGGKPLFSLRVMPWADNSSGNRSKQYNPHLNLCTQNLSVPHGKLKHQYFVHFGSTSQHASSGEQFRPLIETWYGAFICRHHWVLIQFQRPR